MAKITIIPGVPQQFEIPDGVPSGTAFPTTSTEGDVFAITKRFTDANPEDYNIPVLTENTTVDYTLHGGSIPYITIEGNAFDGIFDTDLFDITGIVFNPGQSSEVDVLGTYGEHIVDYFINDEVLFIMFEPGQQDTAATVNGAISGSRVLKLTSKVTYDNGLYVFSGGIWRALDDATEELTQQVRDLRVATNILFVDDNRILYTVRSIDDGRRMRLSHAGGQHIIDHKNVVSSGVSVTWVRRDNGDTMTGKVGYLDPRGLYFFLVTSGGSDIPLDQNPRVGDVLIVNQQT